MEIIRVEVGSISEFNEIFNYWESGKIILRISEEGARCPYIYKIKINQSEQILIGLFTESSASIPELIIFNDNIFVGFNSQVSIVSLSTLEVKEYFFDSWFFYFIIVEEYQLLIIICELSVCILDRDGKRLREMATYFIEDYTLNKNELIIYTDTDVITLSLDHLNKV